VAEAVGEDEIENDVIEDEGNEVKASPSKKSGKESPVKENGVALAPSPEKPEVANGT